MAEFDPKDFVENQVKEIKKVVREERALIAVSGGVDSTTSAVLTHRAMGENLLCDCDRTVPTTCAAHCDCQI